MDSGDKREWGAARKAFLAQLPEVRRLIAAGSSFREIHAKLKWPGTYGLFCQYVRRYIGDQTARARPASDKVAAPSSADSAQPRQTGPSDLTAGTPAEAGTGARPQSRWRPVLARAPASAVPAEPDLDPEDEAAAFRPMKPTSKENGQ